MKSMLVLAMIGLVSCSVKTCKIQKYPLPVQEELDVIKVLKCESEGNCVPESSPYRFIDINKLLNNNQKMRTFIDKLKNNPTWLK